MSPCNDDVPDCARSVDVAAWLQRELTGAEGRRFEAHLRVCPRCQDERRAVEISLLELSFHDRAMDRTPQLVGAVLERLPSSAWAPSRWPSLLGVATAALMLLVGGLISPEDHRPGRPLASPVSVPDEETFTCAAADWIIAQQDPVGFWVDDPAATGPSVRTTALCIAALAEAHAGGPGGQEALDRGCAWLVRLQCEDGVIGSASGEVYAHAYATLALLIVYRHTGWPGLERPARRALASLATDRVPLRDRHRLEVVVAALGWGEATLHAPLPVLDRLSLLRGQRIGGRLHGSVSPTRIALDEPHRTGATARSLLLVSATRD